jgi:hypothetical protein
MYVICMTQSVWSGLEIAKKGSRLTCPSSGLSLSLSRLPLE